MKNRCVLSPVFLSPPPPPPPLPRPFFSFFSLFYHFQFSSSRLDASKTARLALFLCSLPENLLKNINWNDMTITVTACAELVQRSGLAVFGIQFYGECWSGVDAWKTYDKYGPSKDCWSGVGREGSYFVYKLTK